MRKKDDEGISEGSRRYDRADSGKQESKERTAAQKGKLQALKRLILKQKIEEQPPKKEKEDPDTFGAQTLEEEIEASVQDAKDRASADSLIMEEKIHDQEIDQADTEKQEDSSG